MYASFDFAGVPGAGGPLNRTWTISSHPDESAATGTFSISVKRAGLVSTYLHRRAVSPKPPPNAFIAQQTPTLCSNAIGTSRDCCGTPM